MASGFIDSPLDFNELLVERPAATFVLQASGPGVHKLGLHSGDLLIVDRSKTPYNGCLIVCPLDDDLHIKQYRKTTQGIELYPHMTSYGAQTVDSAELTVWGVVTYVIHKA